MGRLCPELLTNKKLYRNIVRYDRKGHCERRPKSFFQFKHYFLDFPPSFRLRSVYTGCTAAWGWLQVWDLRTVKSKATALVKQRHSIGYVLVRGGSISLLLSVSTVSISFKNNIFSKCYFSVTTTIHAVVYRNYFNSSRLQYDFKTIKVHNTSKSYVTFENKRGVICFLNKRMLKLNWKRQYFSVVTKNVRYQRFLRWNISVQFLSCFFFIREKL